MTTDVLWQMAGIGILVVAVHAVLRQAGRDELAWLVTVGGVSIVLFLVVRLVGQLFDAVRAMFQL